MAFTNLVVTMTSNTTPSPNVASANSEYGASAPAWEAFDHNVASSSYWRTAFGATLPAALAYSWGVGNTYVVNKYALTVDFISADGGGPEDFTFEGFNGVDWDVLDTQTGQTWTDGERKEYACSNATAYYKYRLLVTNYYGSSTYLRIREFEMGYAASFTPGAGSLALTGQTPSIPWSSPGAGALAVTGQIVRATGVRSVAVGAGALALTGQTPVAVLRVVMRPGTRQMGFAGQTPSFPQTNLSVTLPNLAIVFGAKGVYSALAATLPGISFSATTGPRSVLAVTVPQLAVGLSSGSSLATMLPELSFSGTATLGAVSTLAVVKPRLRFSARMGGKLVVVMPAPSVELTALVGTASQLAVRLPRIRPALAASLTGASVLGVTIPKIVPHFTGSRHVNSVLTVSLPDIGVVFVGHPGVLSTLAISIPDLVPAFTSYQDSTSALAVTVPVLRFVSYGAPTGRFDDYVLSFTRPT